MNKVTVMRFIFVLCAALVCGLLHAQPPPTNPEVNMPKVVQPSPNASVLGKYGELPVSYYTGTADISIPLYTIQSGDITIPISLSYHTGGIRVNELAGWTGLGWALNAGGVVSRRLIDKDDLTEVLPQKVEIITGGMFPGGAYAIPHQGFSGTSYGITTVSASTYDFEDFYDFMEGTDAEFDVFSYNMLGKSGRFIKAQDGTIVLEKQDDIRVDSLTETLVKVTDENGFAYSFSKIERATLDPFPGSYTVSWYLSRIVSPKGNSVTFSYTSTSLPNVPQDVHSVSHGGYPGNYTLNTRETQFSTAQILTRIDFDQGYVQFTTDDERLDYGTGSNRKRITGMKVYKTGATLVKESEFKYSYFNGNKRMRLDEVVEKSGSSTLPSHKFKYHDTFMNGDGSLPFNDKGIDFWGFFNNRSSNPFLIPRFIGPNTTVTLVQGNCPVFTNPNLCLTDAFSLTGFVQYEGAKRDAVKGGSSLFSLKSVTYPTGGRMEIETETNEAEYDSSEFVRWPQYVLRDSLIYFDALGETTGTLSFLSRSESPITADISFIFFAASARDSAKTLMHEESLFFEFAGNHRDFVRTIDCGGPVCKATLTAPAHTAASFKSMITNVTGRRFLKTSLHVYWTEKRYQRVYNSGKTILVGGQRVKKVKLYDEDGNLTSTREFDYSYTADKNEDSLPERHSYGKLMSPPTHESRGVLPYFRKWYLSKDRSYCPLFNRFGSSITSPSTVVGYSKVTEFSTGQGGSNNGKTIYTYINRRDSLLTFNLMTPVSCSGGVALDGSGLRPAGVSDFSYKLNGSLSDKEEYTWDGSAFSELHKTHNEYSITDVVNCYNTKVEKYPWCTDGTQFSAVPDFYMVYVYPAIQHARILLNETTDTFYDPENPDAEIITTTTFGYKSNHEQLSSKEVTRSDGRSEITRMIYPQDYGSLATNKYGVKNLLEKNIKAMPVEQYQAIREGSSETITAGTFTAFHSSMPLPDTVFVLETATPVASASFHPSNETPDAIARGTLYKPRLNYFQYDTRGNVRTVAKINDMYVSYIWGYSQTYPIAEIKNAPDITRVFFSSFEDTGTSQSSGNPAHTGRKYLNSGSFNFSSAVSFSPSPSTNLSMSYWYWSSSKWNFSGVVPFSNTISAGTRLDDIRVYPSNAQMTSYTHDPLVGITSQSNENDIPTYYEYDEFNRLVNVKDDKGNILKTTKYHYKNR